MSDTARDEVVEGERPARHTVRLPRLIVEQPVGLGQIIKRVTGAAGMTPCGPCEQRAARLDRWLEIAPSASRRTDP